ncbi:hypothetical protein [Amphritea sp. HPY]|uniref:tetratricopeptide repeat protein n=1 Tax=Amphritea sp. HPY TaxID=3421652 RepID=UPI003D7CC70B
MIKKIPRSKAAISLVLLLSSGWVVAEQSVACKELFNQTEYSAALTRCQKSAEEGDREAAFSLARFYAIPDSERYDLQQTFNWLQQATGLGHPEAAYNLAVAYQHGDGTARHLPLAVTAYRQAIEFNNPKAMRNLAMMYESGSGVERDFAKAFELFERSARLGRSDSQFKVASMLLRGKGVDKDPVATRYWLDQAAGNNDANAQLMLAILLADSDFDKSLHWYKESAQQDNVYALHNLALIYFSGEKVERDLLLALAYADKSIALGNDKSRKLYMAIASEVAPAAGYGATTTTSPTPENSKQSLDAAYRDPDWLAGKQGAKYVAQLILLSTKGSLKRFVEQHQLAGRINYLHRKDGPLDRYAVLYAADSSDKNELKQTLQQLLPENLVENAWIRSYASLQQAYKAR